MYNERRKNAREVVKGEILNLTIELICREQTLWEKIDLILFTNLFLHYCSVSYC